MTRLVWGNVVDRQYHIGVDRGVFYDSSGRGQAWSGLVSVVESSDGESASYIYLDGIKLTNRKRFGDFIATVEAFSYPEILDAAPPQPFSFTYRVLLDDHYQIHIVYNATATIQGFVYSSLSSDVDTALFSIDVTTLKSIFDNTYRTAHIIIDTRNAEALSELENVLYGDSEHDAHVPTPEELIEIFESHALIRVTDNHDGTFTISGPDELVHWVDSTTFEVISDGITWLDSETYRIRST